MQEEEEGRQEREESQTMRRIASAILGFTAQRRWGVDNLAEKAAFQKNTLLHNLTPRGRLSIDGIDRLLDALDAEIVVRLHPRQKQEEDEEEEKEELEKVRAKVIKKGEENKKFSKKAKMNAKSGVSLPVLWHWMDKLVNNDEVNEIDKDRLRNLMRDTSDGRLTLVQSRYVERLWDRLGE